MIKVRNMKQVDFEEVRAFFSDRWAGEFMVTRGTVHKLEDLSGFVAFDQDEIVGLITYNMNEGELEITSLDSLIEKKGIGTTLLKTVINLGISNDVDRVFLITTNDNIYAMKFYQRIGFSLCAFYKDAVQITRTLKPDIPLANDFIKIEHELEFEMKFD